MRKTKNLIILFFISNLLNAQTTELQFYETNEINSLVSDKISNYKIYDLDLSKVELLDNYDFIVKIENKMVCKIHLERNNLLSENVQRETEKDNQINTYKGFLISNPNDHVRLSFYSNLVEGYIQTGDSVFYIIPLKRFSNKETSNKVIFCNGSDLKDDIFDVEILDSEIDQQIITKTTTTDDEKLSVVRFAIEADYEFYRNHGTSSSNFIVSILNMAEGVYQEDLNVYFRIVYMHIYNSFIDPFDEEFTSYNAGTALLEFKNFFISEHNSVSRDVAFLFTGKGDNSTVTGVSYTPGEYAIVKDFYNSSKSTAHELGHCFNGRHELAINCGDEDAASLMCQGDTKEPLFFSSTNISQINNNINSRLISFSGPQLLCSSETFSISNLPSGATILWECSDNISRNSSQGSNPCIFSSNGTGEGFVSATITVGTTNFELPMKEVHVGEVPVLITGTSRQHCGSGMPYFLDDFSTEYGESFYWDSDFLTITNRYSPECLAGSYQNGSGYLSCTVSTCGSSSNTNSISVRVICLFLNISPNPSNGETIITIEEEPTTMDETNSELVISNLDLTTEWDLQIYDISNNLKMRSNDLKGDSFTINTSAWKEGLYMVQVLYKDEILTGKLVVR